MSASIDPEYEYHEFYLDSSDATNAVSTTISALNWPSFNLTTALKDVASFKVLECQIPMSYCVTAGGSIDIYYYPTYSVGAPLPTPVIKTYTLPTTGNPSGAQIAADLSTKFQTDSPVGVTGWLKGGTQIYLTCTFVPSGGDVLSTGLPYFIIQLNDHNTSASVTCDYKIVIKDQRSEDVLGFPVGATNCSRFGLASNTSLKPVSSPRPTLITGSPYLYISSNTIGNLCKTYLPLGATLLGGGVSSPQLAKIPISSVVQGQWLVWQDANQNWFDVDNIATLSQIDFYVQLGNYGGYIDFQGLPFSIKLGVLVKRSSKVTSNGRGTYIQSQPYSYSNR